MLSPVPAPSGVHRFPHGGRAWSSGAHSLGRLRLPYSAAFLQSKRLVKKNSQPLVLRAVNGPGAVPWGGRGWEKDFG